MRRFHRAAVSLMLTSAAFCGTGCVGLMKQQVSQTSSSRAELKMNAARLEESRGNLLEAKKLYTEVHLIDPQNGDCSYRLAKICTLLNQNSEAVVYFEKAYSTHNTDPEFLAEMGYSAFLRKDYVQSEKLLEQSLRINTQNRRAVTNLAIARAWLKKDELSLATFRCVSPEVESLRNLAAIQFARGDRDLGKKNYELAKGSETGQQQIAASAPPASVAPGVASITAQELLAMPPLSESIIPLYGESTLQVVASSSELPYSIYLPAPAPIDDPATVSQLKAEESQLVSIVERADVTTVDSESANAFESLAPSSVSEIEFPAEINVSIDSSFDLNQIPETAPPQAAPVAPSESIVFELPNPEPVSQRTNSPGAWRKSEAAPRMIEPKAIPTADVSPRVVPSASSDPQVDLTELKNICLVTLTEERKLVRCLPHFVAEHQSQKYQFASPEALEKFRADPKRYLPAVGGLDIVSFRTEQGIVAGSLKNAIWYRHHLYVFSNPANADAFRSSPNAFAGED